jgi:hypothetical protein
VAWWYGTPVRSLRTEIAFNGSTCAGDPCELDPVLEIDATGDSQLDGQEVAGNVASCTGQGCYTDDAVNIDVEDGALTLVEPVVAANELTCQGQGCSTNDLLNVDVDEDATVGELQLSDNRVRCEGSSCFSGGIGALRASTQLDLTDAFVGGNAATCAGDFCRGFPVLRLAAAKGTIEGSTFTLNQVRCDGEECATGTGGALRNAVASLTIRDSEITSNATDGFGGAIFNEGGNALTLDGVGVFQNEAGLRGVMEFGGLGGAIYNDASSSGKATLTLVDTQIRGNRSLRQGGGVANEGTIAPPANSAITDNTLGNCVNFNGGTGCF